MITQEQKNQVIQEYLDEKGKRGPITLAFTLSMPNNNSWNRRWSGEGNIYAIIKKFSSRKSKENAEKILKEGYYYYNFGDGWGAGISVSQVSGPEIKKIRKKSQGFCGYDWMVESIIRDGDINAKR